MITRTLAGDWLSDVKEGSLFSVVLPIFQRTYVFVIFFVKVYLEANFEQNHGEMPAVLVLSNFCGILVLTNFCGILDFFRYYRVVNSDFRRTAETVSPKGQVIRGIASDVRDHSYNLSSFQCKVYIP